MALTKLAHFTIRTTDVEASRRFYVEILGLSVGARPPFTFPGLWLYAGEADVVHLIGMDANSAAEVRAYLEDRDEAPAGGTGALDHIAFQATGWGETRARCDAAGIAYTERTVPSLGQHQVFIRDPSGVVIELNYAGNEA